MEIGEDLRRIFLAGVGAVAETAERGKDLVNELVKKGELTLEQGKVLNEELKRNVKSKVAEHVSVTVTKQSPADAESVTKAVESMGPDELRRLKEKIAEVESGRQTPAGESENVGE